MLCNLMNLRFSVGEKEGGMSYWIVGSRCTSPLYLCPIIVPVCQGVPFPHLFIQNEKTEGERE